MKIGFHIMKFTLIFSSLNSKVMWDLASLTSPGQTEQNQNWIFITEFLLKAHFAFLQIIQNVCTTFFYQVSDTDFRWTWIECHKKNTTNVIRHKMNKVTSNRTSLWCVNHNVKTNKTKTQHRKLKRWATQTTPKQIRGELGCLQGRNN